MQARSGASASRAYAAANLVGRVLRASPTRLVQPPSAEIVKRRGEAEAMRRSACRRGRASRTGSTCCWRPTIETHSHFLGLTSGLSAMRTLLFYDR